LPASVWHEQDGSHYAYVRHQPAGCAQPQTYAVRRWRDDGELFDRYAFCACEDGTRAPPRRLGRHDLKGERERMFSKLLTDLDLHHPPCLSLAANQAFYTLAALAYNLLTASSSPSSRSGSTAGACARSSRTSCTCPPNSPATPAAWCCACIARPAGSIGGGAGTRSPPAPDAAIAAATNRPTNPTPPDRAHAGRARSLGPTLPTTADPMAAANLLLHAHQVASLLKRWLLGTHQRCRHGRSLGHEFIFRFNRRSSGS